MTTTQPSGDRPAATDRAVTAASITALLRTQHPDVRVDEVSLLDESSGSANRLRLGIRYAGGHDGGLPATLFLKRNLPQFSFPREMYVNEVRVYRDVVPELDLETPHIYGLQFDPETLHFTLLMSDLLEEPGIRVGHVLDETDPDDVRSLLVTLARLHATFWGHARLDSDLAWLARPTACATMRFWRQIGPRLTDNHLSRGHRAGRVDRDYWSNERIWPAFDALLEIDDRAPRTVLHGDVHAGNVYYRRGAPGGLLDWQLALQGSWALDVTYALTSALSPADRARHERELLRFYLDQLRSHGVDEISFDEAFLRYRQNALYGVLMWFITPDGVHSDQAQLEFLNRCVQAAEQLGTLEALGF